MSQSWYAFINTVSWAAVMTQLPASLFLFISSAYIHFRERLVTNWMKLVFNRKIVFKHFLPHRRSETSYKHSITVMCTVTGAECAWAGRGACTVGWEGHQRLDEESPWLPPLVSKELYVKLTSRLCMIPPNSSPRHKWGKKTGGASVAS